MSDEPPVEPQEEEETAPKKTLTETFDEIRHNDKVEGLLDYAKTNTRDTVAYVLLVLGFVWFFFHPFYGAGIVGIIFGVYYYDEISSTLRNLNHAIDDFGMAKSLVLAGTLLILLLAAPGIFLGAVVSVALKHLFASSEEKKEEE